MAYRDGEISGIGGWLMFFVLTLGVFTPLAVLYLLFGSLYGSEMSRQMAAFPGWPAYRLAETLLALAHLGACAFLTWRLCLVRTWQTVRVTIVVIWMMALGVTLGDMVITVVFIDGTVARVFNGEMIAIVKGLAYAALWTAYLLRSERVANTYPRHGDEAQLAAVFD